MFLSRNKKNNVYPCKPQFYSIKVGLKGVKIIKVCFRDVTVAVLLFCVFGGPGISLTLCCFVVNSTRRFVLSLALCYFVFVFQVLLALRLPRLGKIELILALFVHLFDLRLFGFVCFLVLIVSGMGCGL